MFISSKIKKKATEELENLKKSPDGFVVLAIGKSTVILTKEGSDKFSLLSKEGKSILCPISLGNEIYYVAYM